MSHAHYQLETKPGAHGAQGQVFFGTRIADRAEVAVKVANDSRGAIAALRQEIAVLKALGQTGVGGVMPCLEAIELDGRPALVMPRFPQHLGQWLNDAVVSPTPTTLTQALRTCSALAYTLGRVHQTPWQGGTLVHRDVKPENIFLSADGTPHLGDFGGAMAIGGLARVELTLFGTPMWAPLDQILPGQAIPDPTWDTYALCVFLYAAVTGARPAYQSDPRTLLTPAGRDLWEVARKAVEGPDTERQQWAKHFGRMRTGARAVDLVDVTGHGALVDADRAAIDAGVERLGQLAGLDRRSRKSTARQLWDLLVRGLSPVSHPSPPNRFRDGVELGELLDEVVDRVRQGRPRSMPPTRAPTGPRSPRISQRLSRELEIPPPSTLSGGGLSSFAVALVLLLAVVGAGTAAWVWQEPLVAVIDGLMPRAERVAVAGGPAGPAFEIDRLEVSRARWNGCVAAGGCSPELEGGELPASGIDADQAAAFCDWAGGRLPTEPEWTRVAGTGPMPWGEAQPTCKRAHAMGCGAGLRPVGGRPSGRSPLGVEDLAGNAWEWVLADGIPVLLGGGADSPASELGRAGRLAPEPGASPDLAGLRCVYPPTG